MTIPYRAQEEVEPRRPDKGHVYLIFSCAGYHKIGKTADLAKRLQSFKTGLPGETTLLHSFAADNMHTAEEALHRRFGARRQNGEWFLLEAADVEAVRAIGGFVGGRWVYEESGKMAAVGD